jgi:flavorubredoxin/flavin reductase (DIM6/NTAB) family NADH-FMN oxidoreductase RutF
MPDSMTQPAIASPLPRDVQVLGIAPQTTVLRSRSWSRLRFEIEYARERGTTANSYVIAADKTALLDPPGESFSDRFLDALTQRFDLQHLDYVILGHVNPNRAATLKAVLTRAPHITLVCSNPAAIALRDLLPDQTLNLRVIKSGDDDGLDLGQGHHLQFVPIPTPRYSDGLCVYDPLTRIHYTDKFFGAHICGDQIFDEGWTAFLDDRRYYFDCLMAPHARQVAAALDKMEALAPLTLLAPGHGPLVRHSTTELMQSYRQWLQQQRSQDVMVALLYASAYGNTATVAQAIARGMTKAGVAVESVNCETTEPDEIKAILEKCDGFVIGSPTLGGHAPTQIQTALGIALSTVSKDKLTGVFGSFGWSGEAIDLLETKLRDAGYGFGFETLRVKFKPTDVVLKTCEEAGTDFVQALKKAKKRRAAKTSPLQSSSTVTPTEQAMGRLVGSLCVVTTRQGDLSSAMLASWVAQATFSPPGFTVAVAKDRAIESLLYPGRPFVLNILAEDNYLGLMKHFLKPFSPGEDRFSLVDTTEADSGCPVLNDALAYLDCEVQSRMECGDHWVVYAVVKAGQVLRPDVKTAVHHRKAGNHY